MNNLCDEIINELTELQEKVTCNSDYWTIQMCIEVVWKHKREAKNEKDTKRARS